MTPSKMYIYHPRRAYFHRLMRRVEYARIMEDRPDEFGARGFLRGDFPPLTVNMNAHWMAGVEFPELLPLAKEKYQAMMDNR